MTPNTSLLDTYAHLWRSPEWAERVALVDCASTATVAYGALYEMVASIAGGLRRSGVQPQQRVAVAMERSLNSVIAILGVMAAGACPCPLEPRLSTQEVQDRLQSVGITTVLADAAHLVRFNEIPGCAVLNVDALQEAAKYWSKDIRAEDPGLLLFTSGSTGRPKGVLQSHKGLLNNAKGVIPATGLSSQDKLLHVMPLHHTNGLNNQIFTPLLVGAQVVLGERFRATDMPALMDKHRPSIITGVPTMYSRMLSLDFTDESLAALRFARCGSAPITETLHAKIESLLQCELVVSYGLSEATCTSTINPPGKRKVGSIGQALAFQKVFLRGSDGREITETDVDGEICIEGDSLMLGYLGTKEDGVLEAASATLHSGDLARMDDEGYFYITGRLKDVIIRGGENISPALIEQAISSSPDVNNCCVVARPDQDLGEVPVAFVVPTDANRKDKVAIQNLVSDRLSRIYRLEDVIFVESLPENSVGKIDRKALERSLIG
ncbi:acyl--CoA ligase [Alcaligenaceae bacterium]|nr:acyl--CoA ligase [Alcaligenaceae bacterium]